MKIGRLQISVLLALTAIVWWIALALQGTSVTLDHARPFGAVVGFLAGLAVLFQHVLWRQPWLHGWFVKRPDLRGTWRVELKSSYVRPETNERMPPIICYVGVKQTLSKLQMHLMTPESESWFIAHRIRCSQNGTGFQIIGVYSNEPNMHLRDARISEIHQGAIIIETHGQRVRPTSLTAKYWTDRKTTGTMEFGGRVDEVYTQYSDAAEAMG